MLLEASEPGTPEHSIVKNAFFSAKPQGTVDEHKAYRARKEQQNPSRETVTNPRYLRVINMLLKALKPKTTTSLTFKKAR